MSTDDLFVYDFKSEDYDSVARLSSITDWSSINEKLNSDWIDFLNGGKPKYVRDPILDSWLRSSEANVDPYTFSYASLTKQQILELLEKEKDLIDVSYSVMQRLLEFNPDGHINLCNSEGVALAYCGLDLTPVGSILNETVLGTNSTGRCLIEKKLVYIASEENWKIGLRQRKQHCAAAPIRDMSGELIGVLTLTCAQKNFNQYALGAVHTAAENISQRLAIKKFAQQQKRMLNTINEGIVVTDPKGTITSVNCYFEKLFPNVRCCGRHIDDVLQTNKLSFMDTDSWRDVDVIFYRDTRQPVTYTTSLLTYEDGSKFVSLKETNTIESLRSKSPKSNQFKPKYTFDHIIGQSSALMKLKNTAKTCSKVNSTVLITGESGTGKELIAQSIHNASDRSEQPFVAINCGAIAKELLQSELFGYEEGAYTGAKRGGSPGKFELAQGGTLFLDEIGEMSLEAQTSLLRVIQESELVRIGGTKPINIDVRIIAATHKNLADCIANSMFRQDLFYRLNVLSLDVPSLRERVEDIPELMDVFTRKHCQNLGKVPLRYTPEATHIMMDYTWPGNIRELQNIIERIVSMSDKLLIDAEDLPDEILIYSHKNVIQSEVDVNLKNNEKVSITQALSINNGNMRKSALSLGISRSSLYMKIEKWKIDINLFRS